VVSFNSNFVHIRLDYVTCVHSRTNNPKNVDDSQDPAGALLLQQRNCMRTASLKLRPYDTI